MTARSNSVSSLNSELEAADPKLLGNDALVAAILGASGDCIKVLDLDGRLQFMSEGGKRVMEVDDFSGLKGCPWPDLWTDQGNVEARRAVDEARTGRTARFLGAANTAKGTPKFWDVRVLPINDASGKPTHLLSISTDITERHAAETAARESEMRMKLALGAADMGVWECVVVGDRLVDFVGDERALVLLGIHPEQKSSFSDFFARVAPDDRLKLEQAVQEALETNGVLDAEYRLPADSEASEIWVHARAQTFPSPFGKRLVGTVRDVTGRKHSEARQAILSGELQHRVKNTFAMISAIAMQTLKGEDIADRRAAFNARLEALAKAHDILTANTWQTAPLRSVIEGALVPHISDRESFSLVGPDLMLSSRQALSMALTVHELATNAAKYGALSTPSGKVEITWALDVANFTFSWRELGGPMVQPATRQGFGSRMITRVLAADFAGRMHVDQLPSGIVCTLSAPASALGSEREASPMRQAAE